MTPEEAREDIKEVYDSSDSCYKFLLQTIKLYELIEQEYKKVCDALIDRDPTKSATPLILFKIMVEKILEESKK